MHRRWEKIITFGDNEIEKQKLYHYKNPIFSKEEVKKII